MCKFHACMLQKRDNCAATAIGGKLFACGGVGQSSGPSLKSIECYCPQTNAWESEQEMAVPVHR